MSLLNQKTIKESVNFSGVGLHNGENANITIKPSEPNSGIIFKRIDLEKDNLIFPNFNNVVNTSLNTTIANQFGVKVSTIEHLMGALFGLGVDNALIEIDNEEVPILDGSAQKFIDKIMITGLKVSDAPIKIVKINKKVEYNDGKRSISIEPSKLSLDIDFELRYNNPLIGNQKNKINVYEDNLKDVFDSRTFCLYEDIEKLKRLNLGKGGSLKNAIVIKDDKVLNEDGLRNNLEFVNHKILDCMGDLYLSGYKIIGKVISSQGGHKLTNEVIRKVFSDNKNFTIFELKEKTIPHSYINRKALKSIA